MIQISLKDIHTNMPNVYLRSPKFQFRQIIFYIFSILPKNIFFTSMDFLLISTYIQNYSINSGRKKVVKQTNLIIYCESLKYFQYILKKPSNNLDLGNKSLKFKKLNIYSCGYKKPKNKTKIII